MNFFGGIQPTFARVRDLCYILQEIGPQSHEAMIYLVIPDRPYSHKFGVLKTAPTKFYMLNCITNWLFGSL
jgi:hypothetical protein